MDPSGFVEPAGWYVVWCHDAMVGRLPWYKRFLKSGFQHVWLLGFDGYNWLGVSSGAHYLEMWILPYGPDDDVARLLRIAGSKLMYVESERVERWQFRGILTCVSIVKNLLQLHCPFVWTPYQLYRWLEAPRKGVEVYPDGRWRSKSHSRTETIAS